MEGERGATHIIQDDELLSPTTLVVADGVKEAMSRKSRDELLSEESQEGTADSREVEIVHLEQEAQLERRAIPHELPSAKDDKIVCKKNNGACLQVRDGRLSWDELEVVGGIAHDLLEALVEDGPQREAEGAVERRRAVFYPVWSAAHGALLFAIALDSTVFCERKKCRLGNATRRRTEKRGNGETKQTGNGCTAAASLDSY